MWMLTDCAVAQMPTLTLTKIFGKLDFPCENRAIIEVSARVVIYKIVDIGDVDGLVGIFPLCLAEYGIPPGRRGTR